MFKNILCFIRWNFKNLPIWEWLKFHQTPILQHLFKNLPIWEWLKFHKTPILQHLFKNLPIWEWLKFHQTPILQHLFKNLPIWEWLKFHQTPILQHLLRIRIKDPWSKKWWGYVWIYFVNWIQRSIDLGPGSQKCFRWETICKHKPCSWWG